MMQRRHSVLGACLSLVIATSMTPASACAQGPVYRERWGYLHLENRRAEVFHELRGRSPEHVKKVAELLVSPDHGIPFAPVANALAFLRGVEADEAFLMRASLATYVLPEVVDPASSLATCRSANFSISLPFTMKSPGAMTFELTVRNAAGEKVWSNLVERNCSIADLRMAQTTASAPGAELPDGTYEVELRALFDGKQPREHDPQLRWPFYVMRGYQQRAEAAMANAVILRRELEPQSKALLDGLHAQVTRAFTGEAFAVRSDAVRDLELLDAGLANLAAGRSPLASLTGNVATAMPAGDIVQPCILRMPKDSLPHPMVVFATGSPAYDIGSRRPTAPVMRESSWLLQELAGFGVTEKWHIATVGSPGGGRPYANALFATLQALPKVLPTGGRKPLLVCDREAAAVVGIQLTKFLPHISGVVFVGSGAMPGPAIAKLGSLPVRFVSLAGYPGSAAVDRTLQYLAAKRKAGKSMPDITLLHGRQEPWLFGVSRSLPELRMFAEQVFSER
ncbi:MAG: hypothetical protein ACI9S9_001511 [Planctomycetota bacterium]|jgi:hypothetical protein